MIEKTLADKTRALILKCGDRDDFRIFNANLEKYSYLSFYPYFDDDEDGNIMWDTPALLIGFSDSDSTGRMDRQTAYNKNFGNDDDMFFVDCALAYMLNEERVVISTSEIEPIKLQPISWDAILNAESVGVADWGDLCVPMADYIGTVDQTHDFDKCIIQYLKNQTDIRMKLIFNEGDICSKRKTTLVYFKDELVGALTHTGYDGCNSTTHAFDKEKWFSLMKFIKDESGVDKLLERSIVTVMDTTRNPDEFLFVPGVTGVVGLHEGIK